MLTIGYVNFWNKNDEIQDRWFTEFIKQNIDQQIKEVNSSQNPDILISSCFGDINNIQKIKSKVKILFYGESLDRYPPYNNLTLLKNTFDMIIGFKYTNLKDKLYRFPLWLCYYPYYNINNPTDNVLTHINNNYLKNLKLNKKDAVLISRHDRGGQRTKIYNEMIKYVDIKCPGNFKNNTKNISSRSKDKIEYIKHFTYNICPENSSFEGYFTEKIFQSLEAGCIPIYWAIDYPEHEILNKQCYCFIDVNDNNDIQTKIHNVVNNKNNYIITNIFKENSEKIVKEYYDNIIQGIITYLYDR